MSQDSNDIWDDDSELNVLELQKKLQDITGEFYSSAISLSNGLKRHSKNIHILTISATIFSAFLFWCGNISNRTLILLTLILFAIISIYSMLLENLGLHDRISRKNSNAHVLETIDKMLSENLALPREKREKTPSVLLRECEDTATLYLED